MSDAMAKGGEWFETRANEKLRFNEEQGADPAPTRAYRKHHHHRHPTRVVYALDPHLAQRLEALVRDSGDTELLSQLQGQADLSGAPAPSHTS